MHPPRVPCRLLIAHRNADDVAPVLEMRCVLADVLGVIAHHRLQPPHQRAGYAVRSAGDIDAGKALLPVQYVAAIDVAARLLHQGAAARRRARGCR